MAESAISLLEFNRRIGRLLQNATVQRCWVVAETSDVRQSGGHCYMELVQKDPASGRTLAKTRGIIWANRFTTLRHSFESATGQGFGNGLNVMVEVSANFHEQYGLSIVITDINPTYTLGDMARQRLEILNRLKSEGIIDLNKQLEWCDVPQRIAVISAPGAAGYGDFINQLHNNSWGLQFYTCLFPAVMQGQSTVPSVIAALERINEHQDLFDGVVIIRGGGATSDLNSFDNYDLAANIAQFPLPVISGIGHDRDNTVVDSVANIRVKTPTAAAEWLISKGTAALDYVNSLTSQVVDIATRIVYESQKQMSYYSSSIPLMAENIIVRNRSRLQQLTAAIPMNAARRIDAASKDLSFTGQRISLLFHQKMDTERQRLASLEKQVELLSPERVLQRGYSLTIKNGHAITSAEELHSGDRITTRFAQGCVESTVD